MSKEKKSETKIKLFQTMLVVFVLASIVLLIKQAPVQSPVPVSEEKGEEVVIEDERLEISGVKVSNFLKDKASKEPFSYLTIIRTKDYHIFYFPADELFVISITSYPFDKYRAVAEQELAKSLDITEEELCRLNVDITTPTFANPDKAGKVYELSFCE